MTFHTGGKESLTHRTALNQAKEAMALNLSMRSGKNPSRLVSLVSHISCGVSHSLTTAAPAEGRSLLSMPGLEVAPGGGAWLRPLPPADSPLSASELAERQEGREFASNPER